VETARESLSLSLSEMDAGAYVIFELPGFSAAAGGMEASSLDALRSANGTAYFKDDESLWVKMVVAGGENLGLEVTR